MKTVCVMGLGYIGLPTALVAAECGFDVVGFDVDRDRVMRINTGDPVIEEPEVLERLSALRTLKKIRITNTCESADYIIIAVPTPCKDTKEADLTFVFHAIDILSPLLKRGTTVIIESTIPVGTTDRCARLLEDATGMRAGTDFFIAHCPERVLPGKIFYELIHNARIIGGINEESMHQAKFFYKQFVQGPLYLTKATVAEMVKLIENSSRDVAIAFSNQVAAMAYALGLNPFEVIELANKHPRVNLLNPSCGVGGHCIAVDPWFLIETFPEHTQLLRAARRVNDTKPHQVVACIESQINEWLTKHTKQPTVLLLGLTYKADVNDLRESPALHIAHLVTQNPQHNVLVCEPHIETEKITELLGDCSVPLREGLECADIVVCLVPHHYFKINCNRTIVANKIVLDFCGLFHVPRQEVHEQEQLFWSIDSTVTMGSLYPQTKRYCNELKQYKEYVP